MAEFRFEVVQMPQFNAAALDFGPPQMRRIGERLAPSIVARVGRGRNVADVRMAPLKPRYRRRKVRRGAKPWRDLRLTGELLNSIKVTAVATNEVTVAVTGANAQRKGAIRQADDPWMGVSVQNAADLDPVVDDEFDRSLRDV